jgi:hypothetical protein
MTTSPDTPDIAGTAAGVPFVAYAPATPRPQAPAVIAWHLLDAPRTERALAAALPLAALDCWRIYLGLPMTGGRALPGGIEEVMQLGYADAVRNLHSPIAEQAAAEFPAAYRELRERFDLDAERTALVGGSAGAGVAQLVLLEQARAAGITPRAMVLISPVIQLRAVVDALAVQFQFTYPWDDGSRALVDRLDFVARAGEFVAAGAPAVRIIVGAEDSPSGFLAPSQRLYDALTGCYPDPAHVDRVEVAGMAHPFTEPPGDDPAPQNPHARAVDRLAAEWLQRHLVTADVRTP